MVRRYRLPLVATSGGLLAWSNLVVPHLPPQPGIRAVANVVGAAELFLVARAAGLSWAELGLSRSAWRSGARWGGAASPSARPDTSLAWPFRPHDPSWRALRSTD